MAVPTLTLTTLRSQARFLALGDSANTNFSDADSLVAANDAYQALVILAIQSAGDWQIRGDNSSSTSITAGTRAYSLPTNYLRIIRVDIKYPGGAEYVRATPIDHHTINTDGLDEFTTSKPMFDLSEDQLEIYVSDKTASIGAVTNGIIVYYEDDITALATGDDAPNIPQPFAYLMALKMARYYCIANEMKSKADDLEKEIAKEEARFMAFIANRNEAKRLSIRPRREDYGQSDMGYGNISINPSK